MDRKNQESHNNLKKLEGKKLNSIMRLCLYEHKKYINKKN